MSSIEERLNRALPGGLTDSLLHTRILRGILELPENTASNILSDFERTLTSGRSEIRNPGAYLNTVIMRTAANLEEEKQNPRPMPPALRQRLELLYSRFCSPEMLDRRCKEILLEIDEASAIRAIDELEGNDRSQIQNLSGFFIGILQKYQKKAPVLAAAAQTELDPAPPFLPRELLFGYRDDEYVPEMPRPVDVGARAVASLHANLPVSVEMKLEQLIAGRILSPEELNERIIGDLRGMPEGQALAILNEYANADFASVRNRAAYLIGIIKKLSKAPPMPMRPDAPYLPPYEYPREEPFKRPRYDDFARDPRQAFGRGPGRPVPGPPAYGPQGGVREPSPRGMHPQFEPPSGNNRHMVDAEIDRHVRAGVIAFDDIDESTRDFLAAQSFNIAARTIVEFCGKDMRKIQNKGGFIRGIVRNITEREFPMHI